MKNHSFSKVFKKFVASILVAYFSLLSPAIAFAKTDISNEPVSAPITIPVPVPSIPIEVNTDSVVVTLDRNNAQGGLVYGWGFTLTSKGATAWQIKYRQPTQGEGFYESSGGINPGSSINIRTYINTNKPNGTYVGLATIQYYYQNKWYDGPSVKYTITLTGITAKPDLVVLSASPSAQYKIGDKGQFNVVVKNTGNADATIKNDEFYVLFTLKKEGSPYEIMLTSSFANLKILKQGESKTFTTSTSYPFTQAGKYTFTGEIDPLKQIDESNENNNKVSSVFEVTKAVIKQPIVSWSWPDILRANYYLLLQGANFGSKQGQVIFIEAKTGKEIGKAQPFYWSESYIFSWTPSNLKIGQQYGFYIKTTDGRTSPVIWKTVGR